MKNFKNAPRSASETLVSVLSILPKRLLSEITRVGGHRRDFPEGLSEIRVRSYGRSSLVISGENVQLSSAVSPSELLEVYDKALDCALYAHKDEVTRGFISMPRGVRVGISASGRERGALPLDISSLVFRLPSGESESAGGIFSLWQKKRPRGMLIYSEPGGGKTSALRSLAALISGECALRVAVVDTRREFAAADYSALSIDVLSGYEKAEGVEIAMRTLSPEVIIVDEIGSEREADALLSVGRGGVPIIATAHAGDFSEVLSRAAVKKLYDNGFFDTFIRLRRDGGKFSFAEEKAESSVTDR